jgi:hypothetical protein
MQKLWNVFRVNRVSVCSLVSAYNRNWRWAVIVSMSVIALACPVFLLTRQPVYMTPVIIDLSETLQVINLTLLFLVFV